MLPSVHAQPVRNHGGPWILSLKRLVPQWPSESSLLLQPLELCFVELSRLAYLRLNLGPKETQNLEFVLNLMAHSVETYQFCLEPTTCCLDLCIDCLQFSTLVLDRPSVLRLCSIVVELGGLLRPCIHSLSPV